MLKELTSKEVSFMEGYYQKSISAIGDTDVDRWQKARLRNFLLERMRKKSFSKFEASLDFSFLASGKNFENNVRDYYQVEACTSNIPEIASMLDCPLILIRIKIDFRGSPFFDFCYEGRRVIAAHFGIRKFDVDDKPLYF